jgi:hypothetical protein
MRLGDLLATYALLALVVLAADALVDWLLRRRR